MLTGLETLKVIVSAGDAGIDVTAAEPRHDLVTPRRMSPNWSPSPFPQRPPKAMVRLSSTTPDSGSHRSLVQSRCTMDPSIISDEDMAWLLVDAAKTCLTGYERTVVFVELGCGERLLAIKRILSALLSARMVLPVAILSQLTGWLSGYADSPEEPQLRMMLAVIRLQHWKAV